MEISSEIVYYLNENGDVIKYHKDVTPFCWVYVDITSPEYQEYLNWLEDGNIAEAWNPEELNGY